MDHHTKKFTEKGLDLFVNYVLRLILYEAAAKAPLLIIEIYLFAQVLIYFLTVKDYNNIMQQQDYVALFFCNY